MVAFDRPVGAPADVQELEYVSALHQTSKVARRDGSINDHDVQLYLRSRFGLELSLNEIRQTIFQGMGGSAQDGEVIDLMEMTAILLIPYLNKLAIVQNGGERSLPEGCVVPTESDVLKQVWEMILHDAVVDVHDGGSSSSTGGEMMTGTDDEAPKLNVALIQKILFAYGEDDLAKNTDLCQAMVDQMVNHDRFTVQAFSQALTEDVKLYDVGNEVRYTNSYQDIMERDDLHQDFLDHGDDDHGMNKTETFHDEYSKNGNTVDEETTLLRDDAIAKPAAPKIKKRYSAPAIDSTNGTYRSKTLIVVLWASTLFSYIAFTQDSGEDGSDIASCPEFIPDGTWEDNSDTMTCEITVSIGRWLWAFFVLCIFGMVYIGCGSCGNADGNKRSWKPIFAILFLFFGVIVPNITVEGYEISGSDRYIRLVSILLASVACFMHLLHIIYLWSCTDGCKSPLNKMVNSDESALKRALAFKMDRVVTNALEIHHTEDQQNIVKSCFGYGLHVFSKWTKTERVGGDIWVWKNLLNKHILAEEGVWYSARLAAANLSQYIVVVYLVFYFINIHYLAMSKFDKETNKQRMRDYLQFLIDTHVSEERVAYISQKISSVVSNFLTTLQESGIANFDCSSVVTAKVEDLQALTAACPDFLNCTSLDLSGIDVAICSLIEMPDLSGLEQLALLASSGFDLQHLVDAVHDGIGTVLDNTVDAFYPNTLRMITLPVILGGSAATLTTLYLAVSYFPSVTSTILQLRSGVIPLLGSKKLNVYRAAPDTVTTLTGALFWGSLFSGIIVGGVVGIISFFVLWQKSVAQTQKTLAMIAGIVVIAGIRTIIMTCGRTSYFQSFYRKRPAGANIYFLAMEWANFALSAGFVFVRMVQLMVAAAMNVGRIDAPFLAPGVGQIMGVDLDPFPTIHLRDILATEAHRHPYIELLGKVYLMKLRYGTKFGSNAGSCWRLIFVYALMPWMQKYRIFDSTPVEAIADEKKEDDPEDAAIETKKITDSSVVIHRSKISSVTSKLTSVKALQSENDELRQRIKQLEKQAK